MFKMLLISYYNALNIYLRYFKLMEKIIFIVSLKSGDRKSKMHLFGSSKITLYMRERQRIICIQIVCHEMAI